MLFRSPGRPPRRSIRRCEEDRDPGHPLHVVAVVLDHGHEVVLGAGVPGELSCGVATFRLASRRLTPSRGPRHALSDGRLEHDRPPYAGVPEGRLRFRKGRTLPPARAWRAALRPIGPDGPRRRCFTNVESSVMCSGAPIAARKGTEQAAALHITAAVRAPRATPGGTGHSAIVSCFWSCEAVAPC